MFGIWRVFFGPVGINLGVLLLGMFVLTLAIVKKIMGKQTRLFEIALLLFLVSFLYFTLHSRLLQTIYPISLPEKPLIDNNLTFNYFSTSLLTYLIFPILLLFLITRDISLKSFGLHISDRKQTVYFALLGSIIGIIFFIITNSLFGYVWIPDYTLDGLVLWILFVSIFSGFLQAFFFVGVLFFRYLN